MANKEERPRVSYSLLNSSLPLLRSELPSDNVNQVIVRACERLEAAMVDEKKSYKTKVEALMSSLESVLADCLIRASPETTSIFFDFLLKHTLVLVLNREWGEKKAVKLHMVALFRRFRVRAEKKKLVRIVGEVDYLIHLMENDPWGNSVLRKILGDETVTEAKLLDFIKSELGVFLSVRLEVMVHARMELQAMTLLRKCLFCIATNEELFESSIEDIIYLRDFYLLILNKAKCTESITQMIFKLVRDMGWKGCVGFVKRCLSGELPFELLCKMSANVVLTMALTSALNREDTDDEVLREMIQLWFEVVEDGQFNLLRLMVSKAVCPCYVYAFAGKLTESVKLKKEVCIEVFVRGLTFNLNEIEKCLVNDRTKVKQLKVQLSNGYLQLAEYLKKNKSLYKELLLAAFSVHPTQESFERIKSLEESGMTSNLKKRVESNQEGNKLPLNQSDDANCGEDSPARSESDLPPPPLTPVSLQTNPNEVEDGFCFFEEPPHLSPQRLMLDSDCQSKITHSESSEKTTDCCLTQQVSDLMLEELSSVGDQNKENISDRPSKFGSGSKTLTCLQVYDADSLGIPQALCDDLSSVIYSVKRQDLCDLEWSEIVQRCETYLQECNSVKKVDRWPTKGERKEFCDVKKPDRVGITNQTPTKKSKRKRKQSKKYDDCVC